jgi:hypothetical protein
MSRGRALSCGAQAGGTAACKRRRRRLAAIDGRCHAKSRRVRGRGRQTAGDRGREHDHDGFRGADAHWPGLERAATYRANPALAANQLPGLAAVGASSDVLCAMVVRLDGDKGGPVYFRLGIASRLRPSNVGLWPHWAVIRAPHTGHSSRSRTARPAAGSVAASPVRTSPSQTSFSSSNAGLASQRGCGEEIPRSRRARRRNSSGRYERRRPGHQAERLLGRPPHGRQRRRWFHGRRGSAFRLGRRCRQSVAMERAVLGETQKSPNQQEVVRRCRSRPDTSATSRIAAPAAPVAAACPE